MGNQDYINNVARNNECLVCFGPIPMSDRNQKHRVYCSQECRWSFDYFRKKEGLMDYPVQIHYGRQATKHREETVHRY